VFDWHFMRGTTHGASEAYAVETGKSCRVKTWREEAARRFGRLTSRTDELGNVTSYTYDHEGRVLSVTGPDPDGAGSLTAPVESYTYNALGSVLTMTDAGGHVTSGQQPRCHATIAGKAGKWG
jgi:YD repeat-containing protein